MTGRHRLGDGTVITVPMNAAWFDAYGWSVENHGVDPDLEALRTPLDWAEGRHAQLDDAVHLALDLLETHPAATPPDYDDVPDRAPPEAAAAGSTRSLSRAALRCARLRAALRHGARTTGAPTQPARQAQGALARTEGAPRTATEARSRRRSPASSRSCVVPHRARSVSSSRADAPRSGGAALRCG